MVQQSPNRDESLFNEMSGRTFSSGWCRAPIIVAVGLVTLIVASILVWTYIKPLGYDASERTVPIRFGGIKLPVSLHLGKTIGTSEEYRLRLTNADLELLFGSINIPNTIDQHIATHPKFMEITAMTVSPIRAPLVLKIVPKVSDGKITIEVDDLTVGGIRVLPLATPNLRQSIANGLQSAVDGQIKGRLTKVILEEGVMNIYWKAS